MQIAFAIQILTQLLGLVPAATQAWQMVQDQRNALEKMRAENRDPTVEEWAALDAITEGLRKQLHS